jgi:hypothetical protein
MFRSPGIIIREPTEAILHKTTSKLPTFVQSRHDVKESNTSNVNNSLSYKLCWIFVYSISEVAYVLNEYPSLST